ncbi:hypothetical protein GFM13_37675, partial [Rhizobium leguminosarum bv. viciae]|nr:hypothetical protein [Rhizobium leguminosarum bv. viciae]
MGCRRRFSIATATPQTGSDSLWRADLLLNPRPEQWRFSAVGSNRLEGHAPATVRRRLANWSTLTKWRGLDGAFA